MARRAADDRSVIILDSETTGLLAGVHEITECAWLNRNTGACHRFVPPHTLDNATEEALEVSGYYARRLWVQSSWDEESEELALLHAALSGNWFIGSKPTFDAGFLSLLFVQHGLSPEPWWRFPIDIGTYAAGVLSRPITDRVGLTQLCHLLGVQAGDHTAMGDVLATDECLTRLEYHAHLQRTAS